MKQEYYKNLQSEAAAQLEKYVQQANRYTLYRTICFFALIFAFAAAYDGLTAAGIIGLFMLLLFCQLIRQHNRLKQQIQLVQNALAVTDNYLAHFNGHWQELADKGEDFYAPNRPQDIDLHIFGKASLYQYLCCCRTALGRQKLAKALTVTPPSPAVITQRQKAVAGKRG